MELRIFKSLRSVMNRLRQLRGHIPRLVPETVERLILVIVLKGDRPVFTVGVLKRL